MTSSSLKTILQTAIRAAVKGGSILERHADDAQRLFRTKESFRDVVTSVDEYAQEEVIQVLKAHSKEYPIVAEEKESSKIQRNGTYWVVDPLDGTVNYIHHIPFYAVSVAFIQKGQPVAGAIFNPATKELFYGANGIGVYKNEQKIKTWTRKPEQALFAVTFSGKNYLKPSEREKEFLEFGKVNDETMGCLRTGSAAMNLAYLAQGSFGGCWGRANKWWDVAAGLLLAELAGANVSWNFVDKKTWLVNYKALALSASPLALK